MSTQRRVRKFPTPIKQPAWQLMGFIQPKCLDLLHLIGRSQKNIFVDSKNKNLKPTKNFADFFEQVFYALTIFSPPIPGPIITSTTNDYAILNLVIHLDIQCGHTPWSYTPIKHPWLQRVKPMCRSHLSDTEPPCRASPSVRPEPTIRITDIK